MIPDGEDLFAAIVSQPPAAQSGMRFRFFRDVSSETALIPRYQRMINAARSQASLADYVFTKEPYCEDGGADSDDTDAAIVVVGFVKVDPENKSLYGGVLDLKTYWHKIYRHLYGDRDPVFFDVKEAVFLDEPIPARPRQWERKSSKHWKGIRSVFELQLHCQNYNGLPSK